MRGLTATGVIVVVTAAISLVVTLGGYDFNEAIMRAGFIPARLSGVPTDYWAVPVWLTPLTSALIHSGLLHLMMNMHSGPLEFELDPRRRWARILDTALDSPADIATPGTEQPVTTAGYLVTAHSIVLLRTLSGETP